MQRTQGLTSFLLASALLFVVVFLRRVLERRRVNPNIRQFFAELGTPQRLLFLYVAARLVLYSSGVIGLHPSVARAVDTASRFFGLVGVARLCDSLTFALIRWRGKQGISRILRTLMDWAVTAVIAAALLRIEYRLELSSLVATSALLSVVLGFALQETLGNLFAGLTLNAEQPFETGEWVTFGKHTGRVLDVGWRSTRLLTLDEDEILVPNSLISREVVINHMRPQLTDVIELSVTLDLDVSPARAKRVLCDAVLSCGLVQREPPPVVQLASFIDWGVRYRIQFHTDGFHLERAAIDQVQEAIWYALRRAAIDMPFPQTTVSQRERPLDAEARRRREHMAEAADLLGRVDFVQALSPEARQTLAERARFLEYGPGQAVVRQGEQGDTLYLVARGELRVHVRMDHVEKEVARLARGALFGEMSVLTGEPRTATVISLGDSGLLALDRDAFERILFAQPDLLPRLAETMARRKLALDAIRAEHSAAMDNETSNMLDRIRDIFGFKRAAGA